MEVARTPSPYFTLLEKLIDEASAKYFVGQLISPILVGQSIERHPKRLLRIVRGHDDVQLFPLDHERPGKGYIIINGNKSDGIQSLDP